MENFRKYGSEPFRVAVIRGGPGAAGEVAPIARKLGEARGVLEPLQTANTLEYGIDKAKLQCYNPPHRATDFQKVRSRLTHSISL